MTTLEAYSADHKFLLARAAEAAGLADPVAVQLDAFQLPVLRRAKRGPVLPLDGVLIRDWDPHYRQTGAGVLVGLRAYELAGVRFVRVVAAVGYEVSPGGYDFFAVDRRDYARFYRAAVRCRAEADPAGPPPVLDPRTFDALQLNTVGYLDAERLKRVRRYGGRLKRGLLLTGPPGNGKTSACRWIAHRCRELGLEERVVTPDDFRAARNDGCNPAAAVKALFRVDRAGVVFFDDLDQALRDRGRTDDPEDQAVFLGALDGIEATEGVAFVFTTNLSAELIDPAFLRPGRIDAVLHFPKPDAGLRRQLVARWHPDILAGIDPEAVVADTDGFSFAEVEELKNLLIVGFTESGTWDWEWAKRQFAAGRDGLAWAGRGRPVGFAAATNGAAHPA